MIDCGNCGNTLASIRATGLFLDGEPIECTRCGTSNQVSVDDEGNDVYVYVASWICLHGKSEEQECGDCEDAEVLIAACERRAQ